MTRAYPFHVDARHKGEADELAIQVDFRRKMRTAAPQVELVGIPNAGRRTAWEKKQRAKEGLVKGFPDMLAMFDGRTLGLEFKAGQGSVSTDQIDCLNRLASKGFAVGVFRSADTAIDWLRANLPHAFREAA